MSIVTTVVTVKCDHPGCPAQVTRILSLGAGSRTVSETLKACGWQPYHEFDYCPDHKVNK